eukprot:3372265-Pleurochrysis_carterae.AAC.1
MSRARVSGLCVLDDDAERARALVAAAEHLELNALADLRATREAQGGLAATKRETPSSSPALALALVLSQSASRSRSALPRLRH